MKTRIPQPSADKRELKTRLFSGEAAQYRTAALILLRDAKTNIQPREYELIPAAVDDFPPRLRRVPSVASSPDICGDQTT